MCALLSGLRKIDFKKRQKTSLAVDIPDSARKETEYLFYHDIVDAVERYKIPLSLVPNDIKICSCW